ncbi:hypothetical protein RISW2_03575 [Roseivivax isoporae LMG 25204]|uniref:Uncharacterized protein n=2 Tax=Roseivivax TaxID=93682 RepID=X7FAF6_9RHOB|nr:hypothetical protein RISW2_03575 [Roseivivax isoporae LMG 25204]
MLAWLQENHATVSLVVNAVSAVVWLVYLQIFLLSFLGERRSVIVIHIGGSRGQSARVFISNLGSTPIYLVGILMRLNSGEDSHLAAVTDRDELNAQDLERASDRTTQGPLSPGGFRDIGDFATLRERARLTAGRKTLPAHPEEIVIYVVAQSGNRGRLVGCRQLFCRNQQSEEDDYVPKELSVKQIPNLRRARYRELLDTLR